MADGRRRSRVTLSAMTDQELIQKALDRIFSGIRGLQKAHPTKEFTIDGRLVGDLGEMFAELYYDVVIDPVAQADHDGETPYGTRVQVKATFKDALTFKRRPQLYLGLKLYEDGTFEEVYNGPPDLICAEYGHRKGFGNYLLSFPVERLRELGKGVPASERIPRKNGT